MSRLVDLDDRMAAASAAWTSARIAYQSAQAEFVTAVRELHAAGINEVQLAAEFNTTRTTIRAAVGKPRRRR